MNRNLRNTGNSVSETEDKGHDPSQQSVGKVKTLLQQKEDHQILVEQAESLLGHLDNLHMPHVGNLDVFRSLGDIEYSDNWYSLWGSLVDFVRMQKGLMVLKPEYYLGMDKSEIGYKYTRQLLETPEGEMEPENE